MRVNGVSNTTFTGSAFKVFETNPQKIGKVFQETAMGTKVSDGFVFLAKEGEKGDNVLIDLLNKAGIKYKKSKKDYYAEFKKSNYNGDALVEAVVNFNPEVVNKPEFKRSLIQYSIPAGIK